MNSETVFTWNTSAVYLGACAKDKSHHPLMKLHKRAKYNWKSLLTKTIKTNMFPQIYQYVVQIYCRLVL